MSDDNDLIKLAFQLGSMDSAELARIFKSIILSFPAEALELVSKVDMVNKLSAVGKPARLVTFDANRFAQRQRHFSTTSVRQFANLLTVETAEAVYAHLRADRKVEAIKELRSGMSECGLGLKEAKDFVEIMEEEVRAGVLSW